MAIDFIHVRFLNWIYPVYVWFIMENPKLKWMIWGYPRCLWKPPYLEMGGLTMVAILPVGIQGIIPQVPHLFTCISIQRGAPQ